MTNINEQLNDYLQEQLADYLTLFEQMVAINTFSTNRDGVNELASMTEETFASLGFIAERVAPDDPTYGEHLVLTRCGTGEKQIGLVSHLDTVFPAEEEKRNNFYWRDEGERIYGPGTVDIKGGTIVIYMILQALQALVPDLFTAVNWVILLDSVEEAGGSGFDRLCRERLDPQQTLGCLVFEGGKVEAGQAKLVVTRKGMAVYDIHVQGKASHAGTAHALGANAAVQMAAIVTQLAALTDYEKRVTCNVGYMNSGTVHNRVPHEAYASVEMRTFDPEIFAAVDEQIRQIGKQTTIKSAADNYPCIVRVTPIWHAKPWPRNPGTDQLFALWSETAATMGLEIIPEERGGLSDGNGIWHHVPTLDGLGPSGDNAHCSECSADGQKDQEYVTRSSLVTKACLSAASLIRLIQGAAGRES